MPEIGLRELKTRASEILRDVRERRARYVITYRGRPVGMLTPIEEAAPTRAEVDQAWDELLRLGEQLSKNWCSDLTSEEILSQMRR